MMPELPEVETVRRIVLPQVRGRQIQSVEVLHPQVISYPGTETFVSRLSKQTIVDMQRRGKFLSFCLENRDRLFLHLRMTGQLLVMPAGFPEVKHTHLVMQLSGETQIRYIDVRRFGRFWLLRKDEPESIVGTDKLGPEPLDEQLTAEKLRVILGSRKKPIKEMLLDQNVIAGIGNIYSDEILFAARIHPMERCADLDESAWDRFAASVHAVIAWAIEANQMSPEEYLAGRGKEYRNTTGLKVYGHAGEPCPRCGAILQKTTIAGRSSVFCPACQRHVHENSV